MSRRDGKRSRCDQVIDTCSGQAVKFHAILTRNKASGPEIVCRRRAEWTEQVSVGPDDLRLVRLLDPKDVLRESDLAGGGL